MKAVLVLLFATSAMADNTRSYEPPVTSIIFTIIFGTVSVLNVIWLVKLRRRKIDTAPLNIEKQTLVNSTLPEGVVASNINVSDKSRPSLLREVRQDEQLAWAHERPAPMMQNLTVFLILATFLSVGTFAVALSFSFVQGYIDIVFLTLYCPIAFIVGIFDLTTFLVSKQVSSSVIYAVTSKRVFIFSSVRSGGCCGGKIETVRAYDLDGIHQTTITRKDDGSGTLTFSASAVDEDFNHHDHHNYGLSFAFTDIPNVTAVKDLIEQYKSLRKKQAVNH